MTLYNFSTRNKERIFSKDFSSLNFGMHSMKKKKRKKRVTARNSNMENHINCAKETDIIQIIFEL